MADNPLNAVNRGVYISENFELDHIVVKSRVGEGVAHDITNRAPLCPRHNRRKGNQRLSLAELREQIVADGELVVEDVGKLINLDLARHQALSYLRHYWASRPVTRPMPV